MKMLLLIVAMAFAGCTRHTDDFEILGTLERDRVELVAEAHEPIREIRVREGEAVHAGQVLLRQEPGAMQPQLEQAQAQVAQAEHRLQELVQGPRAAEILEARAALDAADSTLATAEKELVRARDLAAKKVQSQSSLDQALAQRDNAQGARKQAKARLQLLLEGTRIEQLDQARASLDAARASLAQLQVSAARFDLTAPRDGRIEAIPYKRGERPPVGAAVIVMLADSVPYARVYVPEPWRTRMTAGAQVDVHIDGESQAFAGTVRFVAADATFTPYYALSERDRSRLSFIAEIDLNGDRARALPSGVPLRVTAARATQ